MQNIKQGEFLPKDLKFGFKAHTKLLSGAKKVSDAVGSTMGPEGKVAIFGDHVWTVWPMATKDGVTVAQQIILEDKFEKIGADLIRQAATAQVHESGDGTTLTTILAYELFKEGLNSLNKSISRSELVKGFKKCEVMINEQIIDQSIECDTEQSLIKIAAIACNGDKELGQMIGSAVHKVGEWGLVGQEKSKTSETTLEFSQGFQWDRGIVSGSFMNKDGFFGSENCKVLVTDHCFKFGHEIEAVINKGLVERNKRLTLVVISPEISEEALKGIAKGCEEYKAKKEKNIPYIVWIPAKGNLGDSEQKHFLKNAAAITNAKLISEEMGLDIRNLKPEMLGLADKIISTPPKSIIQQTKADYSERLKELKIELDRAGDDYDTKILTEAIAQLESKLAVIKVGGANESEIKEKMDRIDDAIKASRAAQEEGIVEGGGVFLLKLKRALSQKSLSSAGQNMAKQIIENALEEPIRRIIENSGQKSELIVAKLLDDEIKGYDIYNLNDPAKLKNNMMDLNIIDPA